MASIPSFVLSFADDSPAPEEQRKYLQNLQDDLVHVRHAERDALNENVDSAADELIEQLYEALGVIVSPGKPIQLCDECGAREGDRIDYLTSETVELNVWPKLNPPVQMCDSCTHNAYRSGWEPGR